MTVPKIDTPTYFLEVPSLKKKIRYRPFLIKEKKILLIALQERTEESTLDAIKSIVTNCTFSALDINDLTLFDLEYIFLNLYIKSKGSISDLSFLCENEVVDASGQKTLCGHTNSLKLDLETVQVEMNTNPTTKIMLTETVGIILKYPKFRELVDVKSQNLYDILPQYIDTIFDGEEISDTYTAEELEEFIDSLNDDQFAKIETFFNDLPRLKVAVNIKCSKCGHSEEVVLEGLQSFLD